VLVGRDEGTVRITSVSGAGVLSFDQFKLDLSKRLTFVVGPNGAGKSNMTRLLEIVRRAVECADGAAGDVDRMLASFLTARYVNSKSPAIEARIGVTVTDDLERALMVEFARAGIVAGVIGHGGFTNVAEIDEWAEKEITEATLRALMEGEIVASHPGTQDGRWKCVYEFTAADRDGSLQRYEWRLLGDQPGAIVVAGQPVTGGRTIVQRIMGLDTAPPGPTMPIPGPFEFSMLLPLSDLPTMGFTFEVPQRVTAAQRRFMQFAGSLSFRRDGTSTVSMATVLRLILRRALVQTSDTRLVPSGRMSWSSGDAALTEGGEARLPELLLHLKNGDPAERARYRRVRDLFTEFAQGRTFEVRLPQVPQAAQASGEPNAPAEMPTVWVTVTGVTAPMDLEPEVRIEFAGAGAWEALVLASVLGEQAASVVVLDEPAVALHHNTQRKLAAYLEAAVAQFAVISHSAELLPLSQAADVQLVRLDRDDYGATRAWTLDDACRLKMARKLTAKGNERLPFAARTILGEGQDDQQALLTLCERMGIDARLRNIMIVDCGSRDNLPDYIWFCAQLGLPYLAVMDADASKPDAQANAQAVRNAHQVHGGGELVEFPESLETTFAVRKVKPSLVPDAIQHLPFVANMPDPAHVPAEVVQLAEAIRRLNT
jgi:ABC-type Mn2+/Zn2+ transport system ATPase subunit